MGEITLTKNFLKRKGKNKIKNSKKYKRKKTTFLQIQMKTMNIITRKITTTMRITMK
jgi:hypothetical protein